MAERITHCPQCGSFEFTVVETYQWRGEIDDKGLLGCTDETNEIASIRCAKCGESYAPERFYDIYFN